MNKDMESVMRRNSFANAAPKGTTVGEVSKATLTTTESDS